MFTFLPPSFFASPLSLPLPSCWAGLAAVSFCGLSSFLPGQKFSKVRALAHALSNLRDYFCECVPASFFPPFGAGATPRVVSSLPQHTACARVHVGIRVRARAGKGAERGNRERHGERARARARESAKRESESEQSHPQAP
jgi:hypothetical protein